MAQAHQLDVSLPTNLSLHPLMAVLLNLIQESVQLFRVDLALRTVVLADIVYRNLEI